MQASALMVSQEHKWQKLMKLILIVGLILFFSIILDPSASYLFLAVIIIFLGLFFLKDRLWFFLALSIPALAYGQFVNFPVSANWIYEASLTEVLLLIIFMIFIIDKFINGALAEIKSNRLFYFLFAYLLAALISFINIVDFRMYIAGLKTIAYCFLAYFLSLNLIDNRKKISFFIYSLAATVFILSTQIFMKFYELGLSDKFFFERSSITITIGAIATTAAILVLILPIILSYYFSLNKSSKIKPLLLISFIAGCLAVFLTLGKAAIFSLVCGLIFLFIKLKNKRVVFILAISAFIILSIIFFTSFFSGLIIRIGTAFVGDNAEFRLLEYQTGWKIIKDNFWYGAGAGQQLYYFKKILNQPVAQLVNNVFLQSAIDFGLIGFSLMAGIFIAIFKKALDFLRNWSARKMILGLGFIAALIVSLFNGLAEVTFFSLSYAIIFWLTVGVFYNLKKYESDFSHNN